MQWPSILPAWPAGAGAEAVELPVGAATGMSGFGFDFPQLASNGESALEATSDIAAHGVEVTPAPAGNRWNAAALAASLIFHAVAIAGFGTFLAHEGLEAETDAISVEIVIEPAPEPSVEASLAGDAYEARDAAAPADGAEPAPAERQPDAPETSNETAAKAPVVDSGTLPKFEPLPPLAEIVNPGEPNDASAPDEPSRDPDMAAADLPEFSPLPPLTNLPAAAPPPDDAAERPEPPEPILAVRPSLESQLPTIAMPEPPLFPQTKPKPSAPSATTTEPAQKSSTAKPANALPAAKAPSVEKRKPEPVKSAKTPDRPKARKAEAEPTAAAQTEKPRTSKSAATEQPPGGAKAKGRQQKAIRAGSVASAAASSGDREAYGRKVNSHVQRYKRYPEAAEHGGMKGAVKVSISIGGSGNLASARVTGSSGYPVLDGEALATVRRAAPYPKPPAAFGGTARFSLTLRYSR